MSFGIVVGILKNKIDRMVRELHDLDLCPECQAKLEGVLKEYNY